MMASTLPFAQAEPSAYFLRVPKVQTAPVVFASPHSGRHYPDAFVASSRLDATSLRRSEDAYVDLLFEGVPDHGAPLIAAHYARAYCDLNREPYELDPAMFSGPLPVAANTRSPRVASGLGTIARTVGSGLGIYRSKLSVDEVERRLGACYRPYHAQLERMIAATHEQFGWCLLVDCHSMPSVMGDVSYQPGSHTMDLVLGDCHGQACSEEITALIETFLSEKGYGVVRNAPYSGGFTTCHYGNPELKSHSIQIEINRNLYLDESSISPGPNFDRLRADLDGMAGALTQWARQWRGGGGRGVGGRGVGGRGAGGAGS